MSTKFKNQYRIKSARLQHWDYGSNAAYFITICTANKAHYFGEVVEGKMQLSEIGRFAEKCWHEIPEHFPFAVLDGFVVMPNHVHGIIVIDKPVGMQTVETQNIASLPTHENIASLQQNQNKFGPQSQNLAAIVRGYKIGVTKLAKSLQISFAWQARFYDHVIREDSYFRIAEYIQNNPLKWQDDEYYL
jgi:REP element-mobilizing transposase RayT